MTDELTHTFHCDEDGAVVDAGSTRIAADAPPYVMVIFGATGDLAHRKLLPALYSLAEQNMLSSYVGIVGCGRSATDEGGFVMVWQMVLRNLADSNGIKRRGTIWSSAFFTSREVMMRMVITRSS